jgi:hypothetical protein
VEVSIGKQLGQKGWAHYNLTIFAPAKCQLVWWTGLGFETVVPDTSESGEEQSGTQPDWVSSPP